MAEVQDVAQRIVDTIGVVSCIKLQKLVYYCKAWSLVWDEDPLFAGRVEAWAHGPVIPDLYRMHQGMFMCPAAFPDADVSRLSDTQKESIDTVLKSYGDKSPQFLVSLSHEEAPWRDARGSCAPGERCTNEITDEAMAEYYSAQI